MKGNAAAKANAEMSKHLTQAQRKALGLSPAATRRRSNQLLGFLSESRPILIHRMLIPSAD
jgi:hypothetical protein